MVYDVFYKIPHSEGYFPFKIFRSRESEMSTSGNDLF